MFVVGTVDPVEVQVVVERAAQVHRQPSDRVRDVVVRTGSVIDGIAAATRRAAFQGTELRNSAREVEQLHLLAVYEWKEIAVAIGFRTRDSSY